VTREATVARLKRDILREVVRENVDVIEGRIRPRPRARPRASRLAFHAALVVALGAALFLSINAIPLGRERADVLVVGTRAALPPAADSVALPAPRGMEPSLFRLSVTSIVLDPGHGGHDPGARTASGLSEKEVTLDVAKRLKILLEDAKMTVSMTREGDEALSLKDRVAFANAKKADLFVSIHVNSLPVVKEKRIVETYYLGATSDPHVERLAGEENRFSGYAMHDFRKLLEGVYTGVRQSESRTFALAVQAGLYGSLKPINPKLESRGVKSAPFAVLIATEMPGILAEVSCLSNEEDARRLKDPAYRQAIAAALRDGVLAYAESRNHPPGKGT
jgi:N-acetylmuramoyl-L-alanine amidase